MRPCRYCQPLGLRGRHMDKDCPRKPVEPGGRPVAKATPVVKAATGLGPGKGKGGGKVGGKN
eukprot:4554271-Heterocapsa_arctica.AAC.1